MKINWGHGIALTLVAFIAFIAVLVRGTFMERVDLTSSDYYAQEVAYEQEREYLINGSEVPRPVLTRPDNGVQLQFSAGEWENISVAFKRPDNSDMDLAYTRESLEDNKVLFPNLSEGVWNVEIQAQKNEKIFRWEFITRI